MAKTERQEIRLSKEEKELFKSVANKRKISVSELILISVFKEIKGGND